MTARVRQAVALLLVTISASIPLTPVLASPATAGIDGHVFDSTLTHPLAGLTVSIVPDGSKEAVASTVTDPRGRFRLKGLPGGAYLLLLMDSGGVPLAAAEIEATAGVQRTVSLALPGPSGKKKAGGEATASAGGKKALAAWITSPAGSTLVLVASAVVLAVAADKVLTKNDERPLVASPSVP